MGFNIVPAPILHIKYVPSYFFLHSNFQINIYNINNENSKIYKRKMWQYILKSQTKWKYCIYFTFYQKQLIFILLKISLPKLQGCKTIHHMPFYDKRLRRSCFDRVILNCPNCIKGSIPDWPELYTICEKCFNAPLGETLSFIPGTVLVKS